MSAEVSSKVDKVVSGERSAASKPDERKSIDDKVKVKAVDIGNPVEFWTAWSERRKLCLEHSESKQTACTCFEGIGSVM
jgi:hypothetical protein